MMREESNPSSKNFGRVYASLYDLFYDAKDYAAEANLIARTVRDYGPKGGSELLDVGCGSGSHSQHLAERGYSVTGVDASVDMIAAARDKARRRGDSSTQFLVMDARRLALAKRFDASVMMFAVLGYQRTDEDLTSTLSAIRCHLVAGGVLIFDVWHGPTVMQERPSIREREVQVGGALIHRLGVPRLDLRAQVCEIQYEVSRTGGRGTEVIATETHWMRYFFPDELEAVLRSCGFALKRVCAFPDIDRDPAVGDWSVMYVGVAE